MRQRETLRLAFPTDEPIRSGSPSVAVDEEREFAVVEKELAVQSFDGDWNVVLAGNEV